jgi:hypothetical protein
MDGRGGRTSAYRRGTLARALLADGAAGERGRAIPGVRPGGATVAGDPKRAGPASCPLGLAQPVGLRCNPEVPPDAERLHGRPRRGADAPVPGHRSTEARYTEDRCAHAAHRSRRWSGPTQISGLGSLPCRAAVAIGWRGGGREASRASRASRAGAAARQRPGAQARVPSRVPSSVTAGMHRRAGAIQHLTRLRLRPTRHVWRRPVASGARRLRSREHGVREARPHL